MSTSLYSAEAERQVLGGVIQHPDVYVELKPYLRSSDFSRINQSVWSVIENEIENKGTPTPVIITARLNALGVKIEGLETFHYIDSLRFTSIDKRNIVGVAKEIKKLSIVRTIYQNAERLRNRMLEVKDAPVNEIISEVDKSLSDSLMMFDSNETDAVNLYSQLESFIEERGNNPVTDVGYKMPFKLWNEYYGGLRRGGIYFTASRSGQGKSTFLSYIADEVANVCNPGLDIKVLFLDTEMDQYDQMTRLAAVRTGCPFYLVDTGLWRKDPIWFPKMREALKRITNENRNLFFKQVASMGTDDLCNFVKRWFYKNVGSGGNALIIYDYLKVLAGDGDGRSPEWAIALHKMQRLKDLAIDLNSPLFTALQVNRTGTTTNKNGGEVVDDESVLSISGRIDWLVNFAGILRRKTPDEIAEDGTDFGTHKLIPLKSRFQGRTSSGHQDLVKIMDKGKVKYKQNYLCFNIENFNVEERGDYRTIADLKGITKLKKTDVAKSGGI